MTRCQKLLRKKNRVEGFLITMVPKKIITITPLAVTGRFTPAIATDVSPQKASRNILRVKPYTPSLAVFINFVLSVSVHACIHGPGCKRALTNENMQNHLHHVTHATVNACELAQ